jgi:hypothetical protein
MTVDFMTLIRFILIRCLCNIRQKWDEEDVEMLRVAVRRFGEDLSKVSDSIKQKTTGPGKLILKKRQSDDSIVSPSQAPPTSSTTGAVALSPATSSTSSNHLNRPLSSKTLVFEETPAVESEMEVHG